MEPFVGGFNLPPPSPATSLGGPPPPLPPKDALWTSHNGRVPSNASWSDGASRTASLNSTYSMFANMNAIERSKHLRVARTTPYLQFMVGPLLRYDTVDEAGVWRGAAMIVSKYRPHTSASVRAPRGAVADGHACSCGCGFRVRAAPVSDVQLGPELHTVGGKPQAAGFANARAVLRPCTSSCGSNVYQRARISRS